jgi:hypothetical protein
MKDKLSKLQDILIERLPHIKRWNKVMVYDGSGELPLEIRRDLFESPDGCFYIFWNGRKSPTNHHEFEWKQVPNGDIDKVITRNLERLRNERGVYK